jgi:hypothetical protein
MVVTYKIDRLTRALSDFAKITESFEARGVSSSSSTTTSVGRWPQCAAFRLAYLAPDITCAILEGRQPPGLTFAKLTAAAGLPLAWPEQRKALGFDWAAITPASTVQLFCEQAVGLVFESSDRA